MTHRISPADGVGDVAAKRSEPVAFNRVFAGQLEAEQQVLLFGWGSNHQGERIHTLWKAEKTQREGRRGRKRENNGQRVVEEKK